MTVSEKYLENNEVRKYIRTKLAKPPVYINKDVSTNLTRFGVSTLTIKNPPYHKQNNADITILNNKKPTPMELRQSLMIQ